VITAARTLETLVIGAALVPAGSLSNRVDLDEAAYPLLMTSGSACQPIPLHTAHHPGITLRLATLPTMPV
jgi:hypothetical protein